KYQGSGPEAVRSLFKKARRYAPAIVFIDEIDAIGRARGQSNTAHGEEMALNALLTEMDGFAVDPKRPIFVLAATNFEVEEGQGGMGTIDGALARRFDRKILVDLPNAGDREQYLRMMLKKNKTHRVSEEMIRRLASRSTGMSLANMASVLELASRMAVKQVSPLTDAILDEAYEITKHGAKKEWGYDYLERVARHESGHAFLCYLGGNTPAYLTIVARGGHGGYMEHSGEDMGPLSTKEQLINRIRTSLGGRAAEIAYYGEKDGVSTGASGDLESATRVARAMICNYGMDEAFGMAVLSPEEATRGPLAARVSERVSEIIRAEMAETIRIIRQNKPRIDRMVAALMEKNKLTKEEMEALLREQ
ncbi:MAG: AAA family ATPase, partial [Clostridia bacterium]|nr:AAA family ATPase [Clostridia bacterium]